MPEPVSSDRHPDGQITVEAQGPILRIGIDRREKYNGFTPRMLAALGDAYTRLDEDPDLWVGVLFAHGPHFTAGLERMQRPQQPVGCAVRAVMVGPHEHGDVAGARACCQHRP